MKPSSGSPGLTADEAYNRADGSYQTARQLAASQDFGAAFREASKAWEHVRHFSQDDRCRELARQLQADLRRWGARANHRYQTLLDSDPRLIEQ